MTTLLTRLASRADAWASLEPGEQRRIIQAHAYHLSVYAQACGFRIANPPKTPPLGSGRFGALDSISSPEFEPVLE